MMTVHARSGKITHLGLGEGFAVGDFEELHPGDAALFVRLIGSDTHVVFRSAGDHTGAASCALVQINHHAEFVFALFFFHHLPRIALVFKNLESPQRH